MSFTKPQMELMERAETIKQLETKLRTANQDVKDLESWVKTLRKLGSDSRKKELEARKLLKQALPSVEYFEAHREKKSKALATKIRKYLKL